MINNVVKYYDGDVDLIRSAEVNASPVSTYAPTYSTDITGTGIVNYATLENDGFLLSDDSLVFAEESDNIGYLSQNQSSDFGVFRAGTMTMEISIPEVTDCGGIALIMWQNPIVNAVIYFQNGVNIVKSVNLQGNNQLDLFIQCTEPFNRVRIETRKTDIANQFVKIRSVFFGRVYEIKRFFPSITTFFEVAPNCDDVPAATCDFEALIEDDFTPEEGHPVEVYHNNELVGRFYVVEAQRINTKRYVFSCNDGIMLLDDSRFRSLPQGNYTAAEILDEIEENSALNFESRSNTDMTGFCDGKNCREALAMVAFAQQKMISSERSFGIRFFDRSSEVKSMINSDRIIGKATYTVKAPFTKIGWYIYENSFDGENLKTVLFANNPAPGKAQPNQKSFTQYSFIVPDAGSTPGSETYNDMFAKIVENCGFSENEITARIILGDERVGDLVTIMTEFDGEKTGIIKSMQMDIRRNIVADIVIREVQ